MRFEIKNSFSHSALFFKLVGSSPAKRRKVLSLASLTSVFLLDHEYFSLGARRRDGKVPRTAQWREHFLGFRQLPLLVQERTFLLENNHPQE